nr:competence type IV pilus minor pilin ComGF [Macrococcus goetzii]
MTRSVIRKIKYTALRKSNGFTMIEMMVNLSIIIMIMSLLPLIYMNIYQLSGKSTDHFDVNNAMFQRDLYEELSNADYVEIVNNQLWIYTEDDIIQYLYHKQRIIRKLNQEGYIIMLEGVKNAYFEIRDNAVFLSIERFNKHTITYQII